MDMLEIARTLEATGIGTWVRESRNVAPFVSALHIIAIATVFGTIIVVDLRLLGIPSNRRSFTQLANDLLKWTWIAFAFAVISGVLMFLANATVFYSNTLFQVKMVLLLFAGVNMYLFERFTIRGVGAWDSGVPAPRFAKAAGALSILLWISIVFVGRWIGYTKSAPMPDIDLGDALGGFL